MHNIRFSPDQIDLTQRNPGCEAILLDNCMDELAVPICLGGIEAIGCNNWSVCKANFDERVQKLPDDITIMVREPERGEMVTGVTVAFRIKR